MSQAWYLYQTRSFRVSILFVRVSATGRRAPGKGCALLLMPSAVARVAQVRPGSLAHADGRLRKGDQLRSINGIDCTNMPHAVVVAMLRNVQPPLTFILGRRMRTRRPDEARRTGAVPTTAEQGRPPQPLVEAAHGWPRRPLGTHNDGPCICDRVPNLRVGLWLDHGLGCGGRRGVRSDGHS